MLEGKIIKFYRERQNMLQKDLGDSICSSTHVSKIERGLTEVSEETIKLLSNRLSIDMESEMKSYLNLDSQLRKWHEAIIMKLNTKAESIKRQLEKITLLQMPDIIYCYKLILTRYYLLIGDTNRTASLITEMDNWPELNPYQKICFFILKESIY